MKQITIVPYGFPCALAECPPGLFLYSDSVCFKTEYNNDKGATEAYCQSGEYFSCGKSGKEREKIIVQPVIIEIETDERKAEIRTVETEHRKDGEG